MRLQCNFIGKWKYTIGKKDGGSHQLGILLHWVHHHHHPSHKSNRIYNSFFFCRGLKRLYYFSSDPDKSSSIGALSTISEIVGCKGRVPLAGALINPLSPSKDVTKVEPIEDLF